MKKRVLVTGGCGFLGSHVCELFKDRGWDVVAYDNLTKFEYSRVPYFDVEKVREYNLKYLEQSGIPVIIEDIRKLKTLSKYAQGCDLIAHCAAQPAMTIAIENPVLDLDVNVVGYLNVLECARKFNIPVVNCSTIHVYGTGINKCLIEDEDGFSFYDGDYYRGLDVSTDIIDETYPILSGELTPLHASKRTSEIYTQAYIDTYGIKAANFRLTGIYGPRQFGGEDHGWVANFAIRTLLNLPIKVFGTDKQIRDILYVTDAANAFWEWYKKGCPSGTYNIGGGLACVTSLRSCIDFLKDLTGIYQQVTLESERKGDLYYFCCDTSFAKEKFGWEPTVTPQVGIHNLVTWIERNKEMFR